MSNSIWKTAEEKPRQEQLVAWVDRNGMHAGRFDTCYNCFCACADYRADLRKVKKWCSLENLEDIITQADKAERLHKAVDYALQVLDNVSEIGGIDLEMIKIKQLIKEKDQ